MGRGDCDDHEEEDGDVKKDVFPKEYIRSISEQVYRLLLAESAGGHDPEWRMHEADRMIEKDGDGGAKFSRRAAAYDHWSRVYLRVLGHHPDNPPKVNRE